MPTISERIGASGNDISHVQSSHNFSTTSTAGGIGDQTAGSATGRGIALLFSSVNIPRGATIQSAIITHQSVDNQSGTVCRLVIEAEDADSPDAVADDADWHALVRTAASVTWNPGAWTTDITDDTPDIAAIVQELVDRPGWDSGGAMQFLIHDDAEASDTNAVRFGYTYDNDIGKAALLVVSYVAVGKSAILLTAD